MIYILTDSRKEKISNDIKQNFSHRKLKLDPVVLTIINNCLDKHIPEIISELEGNFIPPPEDKQFPEMTPNQIRKINTRKCIQSFSGKPTVGVTHV